MFRFANPEYLYLLLLLPILLVIHIVSGVVRSRRIKSYGDSDLVRKLMPDSSLLRQNIRFWLLFSTFALSCFVIARPQFGSRQETVTRTGIETIIALDISNSMMAEDIIPNRLEKSKRIVSNLVDEFKEDKVGLILFAGDAYVQLPITNDFVSAKLFLNSITPSLISRQGTNIKDAINLAVRSFTPREGVGKAIIVITDGENHEDGAIEAAKDAAAKGYQLYILGVGSTSGSPIPGDRVGEFRKDKSGNVIITKLNDNMCKELATAGEGAYFYVDNSNSAEKALKRELDKLAKSDIETTRYVDFDEQFHIVAWIALILLVIEMLLSERKSRRWESVKLFKTDDDK